MLQAPEFVVANLSEAALVLERYRVGAADFADYFLAELNRSAGCANTAIFDVADLKSGEPFSIVPVLA